MKGFKSAVRTSALSSETKIALHICAFVTLARSNPVVHKAPKTASKAVEWLCYFLRGRVSHPLRQTSRLIIPYPNAP